MRLERTRIYVDNSFGWNTNCNEWYHSVVNIYDDYTLSINIINWLYDNVEGAEKHVRWQYIRSFFHVKFRHERDFIWFNMRWL